MDPRSYVEEHASAFFEDLREWLAIPSISADPARRDDVRRSAEWLAAHLAGTRFPGTGGWGNPGPPPGFAAWPPAPPLAATGFPVTEVWETDGQPAVFAEWPAARPGAPTVLIYGHHDVQPVDPLDEWRNPPFAPVEQDGRLLARGASVDRGRVRSPAPGGGASLAAPGQDAPPVTLKLLIEGEEESG